MPLYEYQCDACSHRFELIQKFSDPPATACPRCGGAVRKLVSSPAFQFKGSGWYITDYARKDAKGGKETKDSTEGTKEGSKDSKGASKDAPATDTGAKDAPAKSADAPATPSKSS